MLAGILRMLSTLTPLFPASVLNVVSDACRDIAFFEKQVWRG